MLAVHTTEELKLTGNHLKGARPILSFTSDFDVHPHLQLLKELFTQVLRVCQFRIFVRWLICQSFFSQVEVTDVMKFIAIHAGCGRGGLVIEDLELTIT